MILIFSERNHPHNFYRSAGIDVWMKCRPLKMRLVKFLRLRQNLWSSPLLLLTVSFLLCPLPSSHSSFLPQTTGIIPAIFATAVISRSPLWSSTLVKELRKKSSIPSLAKERVRIHQENESERAAINFMSATSDDSLGSFSKIEFRKFPIVGIENIARNVKQFRIALPTANHELGLVTSSFIQVRDPENHIRPYTPISLNSDKGFFDLAIKEYSNGTVSSYFHSLNIGDFVEVRGPFEKLRYYPNMKDRIGMIAGGTGITPMLQILREISQPNTRDRTLVKLLFSNHAESDIMLKEELCSLEEANPNFDIKYIVSRPSSSSWKGYTGRLNQELLHLELPPPCPGTLIYVCGPPSFMTAISGEKLPNKEQGPVSGILKDLGYDGRAAVLSDANLISLHPVISFLRVHGVQILESRQMI